ncbi:hypothetical protein ACCS66_03955 [Rhizobium ruizarguesonis]
MDQLEYSIKLKAATRYMGQDARRQNVVDAVQKLREISLDFGDNENPGRTFIDVPMLTTWGTTARDDRTVCYPQAHAVDASIRVRRVGCHCRRLDGFQVFTGSYEHLASAARRSNGSRGR